MRHKFLVLPVKKLLKSVHIYGSYRKIKTGTVFFGTPGICKNIFALVHCSICKITWVAWGRMKTIILLIFVIKESVVHIFLFHIM